MIHEQAANRMAHMLLRLRLSFRETTLLRRAADAVTEV